MHEAPYDTEAVFQELLAKYPGILAGEQVDPDARRRWLLIAREMAVPSAESAGGRWSLTRMNGSSYWVDDSEPSLRPDGRYSFRSSATRSILRSLSPAATGSY